MTQILITVLLFMIIVTQQANRKGNLKNWRMRILSAEFFLSFLAGKLATF